jgi:hypothetical protein
LKQKHSVYSQTLGSIIHLTMEWLKKIVDNALADMAKEKVLMTTDLKSG